MIHVSATEYLHTNAVLLGMLKSWRLAHKTLNSYLPSLDCKNMNQNSWLNFPNCGFQAPALVSPLAARGKTFLLRDILSWVCLPGEQGKKEGKPRMLSCNLAQTSGFLSCRGQCVGQEAACTPPQNFSAQSQDTSSEHLYTAFKDSSNQSLNNFPYFETSLSLGTFCRKTVGKKMKLVCDSPHPPKSEPLLHGISPQK